MDLNYSKKCVDWEWRLIIKIQTRHERKKSILKEEGCGREYFKLHVEIV